MRDSAFKVKDGEPAFSNAELATALTLCDRYELDPFAKEIHVTRARGRLMTIVGIDGWTRIVNNDPHYDGCEFKFEEQNGRLISCTCTMYHFQRSHPVVVTEYFDECVQKTEPWQKWPRRMLRHKAFIQAARLCFGLSGIVDPDEALRENGSMTDMAPPPQPADLVKKADRPSLEDKAKTLFAPPGKIGEEQPKKELWKRWKAAAKKVGQDTTKAVQDEFGVKYLTEDYADLDRLVEALEAKCRKEE